MTMPTPILVLKGPRVEDESNLDVRVLDHGWPEAAGRYEHLRFPSIIIVCMFLIIEIAGIFNRHLISLLWFIRAVPLLQYFSGDTHDPILIVMILARKKRYCRCEDYDRGYCKRTRRLEEGLESWTGVPG